jgi:chemotaxis protein CheX
LSCEGACEFTDVIATGTVDERQRGEQVTTTDTGERRRSGEARPVITELIDEPTIQSIAEDAWTALVGLDEYLVALPGELPDDVLSSWVDVVGPWTGSVVLTTGRQTAAELTRALLGDHAPELLEHEDVADAFGEIANVVGGNVKAALPGPSGLSLPDVGIAPAVRNPEDVCRVDVLWRGEPLTISVQGALPPLPVPHPPHNPHKNEV